MKFLNFPSKPAESAKTKDNEDPKEKKEEEVPEDAEVSEEQKAADLLFKTDGPVDTVTGNDKHNVYNNASPYNDNIGHGHPLTDVLRVIAANVRAFAESSAVEEEVWEQAFKIIQAAFKAHNMGLVEFQNKVSHTDIPYYTRQTKDGMHIWINERNNTNLALNEAIRNLKLNGIPAVKREHGILVALSLGEEATHDPEEIARFSKGLHKSTKTEKKKCWHTLEMGDHKLKYCYDGRLGTLTIHCSGGFVPTTAVYNMHEAKSKQIAHMLKYQAERYTRMANPATYGLEEVGKPFRLKKHGLVYCGGGKTLVICPDDCAYILTEKGEHSLCLEEGKIATSPAKSFKVVKDPKSLTYHFGDIWQKFGHLLAKRGLFV